MKKLKLKSKSARVLHLKMYDKLEQGWKIIGLPKKTFWGYWMVKLKK
ncbi:MAG: hypothetical protein IMY67_06490 [Bacteroidetes bacterium]|nr:hypothetical protein [Bacteroidota bacterium]